jgi:hypothetical protein
VRCRVFLAVAWTIALVGCGPNKALDYDQLRADPAFVIHMPGTDAIGDHGGERTFTLDGEQPAFAARYYGTEASARDVYAYYTKEVEDLGWVYEGSKGQATTELEVRFWCKPYGVVRISIMDPTKLGTGLPSYPTIFDVAIIGDTSDGAIRCPISTKR